MNPEDNSLEAVMMQKPNKAGKRWYAGDLLKRATWTGIMDPDCVSEWLWAAPHIQLFFASHYGLISYKITIETYEHLCFKGNHGKVDLAK